MVWRRLIKVRKQTGSLPKSGHRGYFRERILIGKLSYKTLNQDEWGKARQTVGLTEILSFMTIARLGRKSCFRHALEKSITMVKYRITAFRVIVALNMSIWFLMCILDWCSILFMSVTSVCYMLRNFSAMSCKAIRLVLEKLDLHPWLSSLPFLIETNKFRLN